MNKKRMIFWALLLSQASMANNLYIIGANGNGEEQVHETTVGKVEAALLKANEEKKNVALNVLSKNQDLSKWQLSKFSLGLGVEGEAGIGPWNLGLAIKQRIFLKRESKGRN